MARQRADLADKVKIAKSSDTQPQVIHINEEKSHKSHKFQSKSGSNIFRKALAFGKRKSDEGYMKL